MKYIWFFVLLLSVEIGAQAQSRLAYSEFGLGIGTLNHKGDIATTTNTEAILSEMSPNFHVFAKRHVNDWFSFGIMSSYGWTTASDENHTHQTRGLEVKTTMFQFNPFIEMNLLRFGKYHYDRKFTIFVRLGGGFLAYNPRPSAAVTYPEEYEVRPDAYNSINFFAATGLRFRLSYNSILTVGFSAHNSGTDDLDGILHRMPGLQGKNDSYGGLNIAFSRALF